MRLVLSQASHDSLAQNAVEGAPSILFAEIYIILSFFLS